MRIGIVAPHIFMQDDILPNVIFSPGQLALDLTNELCRQNAEVTLYTPGPIASLGTNKTADLRLFQKELQARGDGYLDLLKKHPLTFISLARQVQAELLASAFADANADKLDVVHVYMNEEDIGLPFAQFCTKPVVFTHSDPFSFLVKYRAVFPKYKHLNWLSMSLAQRKDMPAGTNWTANIYHGLDAKLFQPVKKPIGDYFVYMGRIIEPKGVHLAIEAVKELNKSTGKQYKLKIAGKHYSGEKDDYWQQLQPDIDGKTVEYVGFVKDVKEKNDLLGNAASLIIPSIFAEPFGMVTIEALACGTPVVGLDSGAIPEVIQDGVTGLVVEKDITNNILNEQTTSQRLADALNKINSIDRRACRQDFETRFTIHTMAHEHLKAYQKLAEK